MSENGTGGVVHVEEIRLGGIVLRFLSDGPSSGAPLSMFEMIVATQARVPAPHHHVGFEEVVYGMEGKLRVMRDEEIRGRGRRSFFRAEWCMGLRIRLPRRRRLWW